MPTYSYRALTQVGEIVSGSLQAPSAAEVAHRIEYLGLIPIEAVSEQSEAQIKRRSQFSLLSQPRVEDVTIFTGDLALLLRTGARINDALEMLAADPDLGRMRPTAAALAAALMSGESFGEAISRRPEVFPPVYCALARVGEASGTLIPILEALSAERQRAEALRRRLIDALRYPAFLLLAASCVLLFFLTFVLPQFADLFRDFNAKLDPILAGFLGVSAFLRANGQAVAGVVACFLLAGLLVSRRPASRRAVAGLVTRLPLLRRVVNYHRTTMFCRNLSLLLSGGVALTTSLRILADMMATTGSPVAWGAIVDRVRHGGKLSDALAAAHALPPMAIRTFRLGEDSGQLPALAGRIAEFHEAKLQRSLDRAVGIVGPLAIILISLIVGGLIVSVMTALLSVYQVVG